MREYKSLAEWLEGQGNPKYAIAEGNSGLMVLVVESKDTLNPGITIYNYEERVLPNGSPYFWMSCGRGVRKEYLPALKKFLNDETSNASSEPVSFDFEVWQWFDDEEGEYEKRIDTIKAVSEYHASALLRDRIKYGKYPKGVWLVYILNGEKIALDTKGRIPA